MDEDNNAEPPKQEAPTEVPPPTPPPVDPPQPPPNPDPKKDQEPKKMSKSEKIMVWATCVIAAGTLVSAGAIWLQWRVMVKGGEDTKNLVTYAQQQACAAKQIAKASDRNATAAERFATSGELINKGIGDAVKKLETQAKASEGVARTAQDSLYLEQRPWVAVVITTEMLPIAPGSSAVTAAKIVARNTGRTPATHFHMECMGFADVDMDGPAEVPECDAVIKTDLGTRRNELERRFTRMRPGITPEQLKIVVDEKVREDAEFVKKIAMEEDLIIPPNGGRPLDGLVSGGGASGKFHYAVGRFTYRDVLDRSKTHTTKFCLVRWGNTPLELCRRGQDMD